MIKLSPPKPVQYQKMGFEPISDFVGPVKICTLDQDQDQLGRHSAFTPISCPGAFLLAVSSQRASGLRLRASVSIESTRDRDEMEGVRLFLHNPSLLYIYSTVYFFIIALLLGFVNGPRN